MTTRPTLAPAGRRRRLRRLAGAAACLALAALVWPAAAAAPAGAAAAADGDARAAVVLILTASPEVVAFGSFATLAGSLSSEASGIAGATLGVSASTDGVVWRDLGAAVTDDAGAFSFHVTPDPALGATTFRVVFAGDDRLQPAEAIAVVGSEADLTAPATPRTVGRASGFAVAGVLQPVHPAGTPAVTLYCYRREGGLWVLRATLPTVTGDRDHSSSQFSATVALPSAGVWCLRAFHEDAGHAATWSPWGAPFTVTSGLDAPVWDRDGVTTIPELMASRLNARQLVVVTGAGLGARTGRLRLYEYRDGDWVRALSVPVRLGKRGLSDGLTRRAGNLTTPTGIWRMARYAFGRRAQAPSGCDLRWRRITRRSWWSSERGDAYNTWVETSRYVYGEHLADYPVEYEFAISTGYNALPNRRVYGRGAGIFVHVIGDGLTAGCVALARADMIRLLRRLDPASRTACAIGTTRTGSATSIYAY